jgi:hypothetical protein
MFDDYEKKPEVLKAIVNALKEVDINNLSNGAAKMIDKNLFIPEIMSKFEISKYLAEKWFKEAIEYNKENHEMMIKQESRIREIKNGDSELQKQTS